MSFQTHLGALSNCWAPGLLRCPMSATTTFAYLCSLPGLEATSGPRQAPCSTHLINPRGRASFYRSLLWNTVANRNSPCKYRKPTPPQNCPLFSHFLLFVIQNSLCISSAPEYFRTFFSWLTSGQSVQTQCFTNRTWASLSLNFLRCRVLSPPHFRFHQSPLVFGLTLLHCNH